MPENTLTKLKKKREALDQQIANHKSLSRGTAIKKLRAYVAEWDMTEDDLFPEPVDPDAPETCPSSGPDYDRFDEPFPEFIHEDTFDYIFLADLEQQRDEIDSEIRELKDEAIARARAFIRKYALEKEEVYPARRHK